MVDRGKRTLRWQENLERAKPPAEREQQYPPVDVTNPPRHYEITAEVAARVNTEIANYNRDRNTLSLWKVLTICLENKIPIPEKVDKFFLNISHKLVGYSRDGQKEARQFISDLVLGTVNEDGGRGVFRSFHDTENERDIVRRAGDIIVQNAGKLEPESLEAIYGTVAQEFDVQPEHVKKLVRLYEADAGSFGFRELLKATTRPPQVFASGIDTTLVNPDDKGHSE
ncbi:hypothetical protein [Bradyrhizobium sp. dw_411]|uniref:hypothetical protein n=1 Tax=Bradyrhizobium sp. dw_411 TaxID=2720082 RepID=UPI001BCED657|nr:hypothetical protein [Bradyrhizobium sp. dw_411]